MLRTDRAHLLVTALTHPGMTGKQNEDRFAVSSYRLGPDDPTPVVFAVVSDGIGGHRAGEVAADIAVETVSRIVAQSDAIQPLDILAYAIQEASRAIAAQAQDDTLRLGMGTTCACVWVVGDRLYTASVGDSRIYLLRGGVLRQLTTDHTWAQEAIERGLLDVEQLRNNPNIHVIHRYLGSAQPPQPDLRMRLRGDESDTQAQANQGVRLQSGDRLLLCSDGLTDMVKDDEIAAGVCVQEPEIAAQALIDLACERGGHDNITVVLMSMPGAPQKNLDFTPWMVWSIVALCLFAAVLVGLTWIVFHSFLPPSPTATPLLPAVFS